MAAADKAAVLRALRQLAGNATYHGAKGMVAVVALCLEEHSGSGVTCAALRRRLEGRVAAQWDAKMAGWQKQLGMVTQLGLQGATPQAVKAKAATIMDSLPRATAAAVLQAAAGAAEGGEKGSTMTGLKRSSTQRPCAVGRREYLHVNVPDERTTARAESVTTWQPPRVHRTARAVDDLPGREARYLPTTAAQRGQLRTLQAYQVDRVPEHLGASDAVFAVGTMMKAVGAWRERSGAGEDATPPVEVVAGCCNVDVLGAAITSESGHLWSARSVAPLDEAQLATALGSPWLVDGLRALATSPRMTASKMRQLLGQTTHEAAVRLFWARTASRLRPSAHGVHAWDRRVGRSVGAIGAGLNFTGLQLARIIDGHVHWMAESCPIAQPAGLQLTRWAGYRPEVFAQAEDPALSHPRMGVAVEAITLSCAPWSISGDGDKIEAALRELRAVMEAVAARRSRVVIFETANGLWAPQHVDTRKRLEALLLSASAYDWESAEVCPHEHCGASSRRGRVFYGAVRLDVLRAPRGSSNAWVGSQPAAGDGDEAGTLSAAEGRRLRMTAEVQRGMIEEDQLAYVPGRQDPTLQGTGRVSRSMSGTLTATRFYAVEQRLAASGQQNCASRVRIGAAYQASLPALGSKRAREAEVLTDDGCVASAAECDGEVRRMRREGRKADVRWVGIPPSDGAPSCEPILAAQGFEAAPGSVTRRSRTLEAATAATGTAMATAVPAAEERGPAMASASAGVRAAADSPTEQVPARPAAFQAASEPPAATAPGVATWSTARGEERRWAADWISDRLEVEDGCDLLAASTWGDQGLTEAEVAARAGGEAPPGWMRWSSNGRRRVCDPLLRGSRGGPAEAVTVAEAWVRYQRGMLEGVPHDGWWLKSAFGFLPSQSDLTPMATAWGHLAASRMRPRGQQHGVYTVCIREARAPSWAEFLMWTEHGDTDWPAPEAASEEEAEAESEGEEEVALLR